MLQQCYHGQGLASMNKSRRHEKPWYTPALVALLTSDIPRISGINAREFERDVETVSSRLANEGESFLTKTLPSLCKVFDLALQKRCPLTHRSFRKEGPSVARPAFLRALLRRIFDDAGWVLDSPDVTAIRLTRQILLWFKKVEKEFSDESLQQAINDFIEVDDALPGTDTRLNSPTICVARILVHRVLAQCPVPSAPRHGPGAVAGRDGVVGKRSLRRRYKTLERAFRPIPWFFSLRDAAMDHTLITERQSYDYGVSRTEFVPKDSSGPRTIGLEPAEYMWCQQAIKDCLYRHIESQALTRGHVNFTDQTINRGFTADWKNRDTLDMSKASDRNSYALVKALFSKTKIWPYLDASRSPVTELPDGRLLTLKKFAPMGSAVCFPVEALTFWALTCAVLHLYAGIPLNLVHRLVYVYGDDLIVPHGFSDLLSQKFEEHGLVLNSDKCCTSGKFRESCGLDSYDGVEVTPIRMKKVFVSAVDPITAIPVVRHGNCLYLAGYRAASRVYRKCAQKKFRYLLRVPIFCDPSLPILYWLDELASPAARIYNKEDQCWRVRGLMFVPDKVQANNADERCYYRESLVSGGPVGRQRLAKEGGWLRTFDLRYRGKLRVKLVPIVTAASDGLPVDHVLINSKPA